MFGDLRRLCLFEGPSPILFFPFADPSVCWSRQSPVHYTHALRPRLGTIGILAARPCTLLEPSACFFPSAACVPGAYVCGLCW